jgi:hypothetical protein
MQKGTGRKYLREAIKETVLLSEPPLIRNPY